LLRLAGLSCAAHCQIAWLHLSWFCPPCLSICKPLDSATPQRAWTVSERQERKQRRARCQARRVCGARATPHYVHTTCVYTRVLINAASLSTGQGAEMAAMRALGSISTVAQIMRGLNGEFLQRGTGLALGPI